MLNETFNCPHPEAAVPEHAAIRCNADAELVPPAFPLHKTAQMQQRWFEFITGATAKNRLEPLRMCLTEGLTL